MNNESNQDQLVEFNPGGILPDAVGKRFDQSRRKLGKLYEAAGLGPHETPYRVAFSEPGVTLRYYGDDDATGPVFLIVPAPIKRPYIWDLSPETSVVQRCIRGGLRVYLIEWQEPGQAEQGFGLAEYGDRLILDCLDAITAETGESQLFLAGHSLGGMLTALFAALHPERVKGFILIGAPLVFGPDVGYLGQIIAMSPKAQVITGVLGNIPGAVLSSIGLTTAPAAFIWERWEDWLASLPDRQARETYLRVDRWAFDEMPLAQRLFEEVVELLARDNRFIRGTLTVGGKRAAPDLIEAPLMSVIDERCGIVPPESILPFHEAVSSTDITTLNYPGDIGVSVQHVGPLVGRQAHQQLWPEIIQWMHDRWEPVA